MVGQNNLLKKLDNFTLSTLPHTILLLGDIGSGRSTVLNRLAKKLNLSIVNMSKPTTAKERNDWQDMLSDNLISYRQDTVKRAYLLDLDTITDKDQTKFLKFIEEPGKNAFIFLKAYNEAKILPTILNRCQVYRMEPYTKDQLKACMWLSDVSNDIIFDICTTPGQLLAANTDDILRLYELCVKIVDKVGTNSYNNFISIYDKICVGDDSFFLFFKTLKLVAFNKYLADNDTIAYIIYSITTDYTNLFNASNLLTIKAKEHFLLNFLARTWRGTHGFTRA